MSLVGFLKEISEASEDIKEENKKREAAMKQARMSSKRRRR